MSKYAKHQLTHGYVIVRLYKIFKLHTYKKKRKYLRYFYLGIEKFSKYIFVDYIFTF